MIESKKHPYDIDMIAIWEKELKVKSENEAFGLPFDMSSDLKEYIKKKDALAFISGQQIKNK